MIEQALTSVKEDEFPTSIEEREKFCMENLSMGEVLLGQGNHFLEGFRTLNTACTWLTDQGRQISTTQADELLCQLWIGPDAFAQAAICFYKALKVYQAPSELIVVYQKTIPPELFAIVMGMLTRDVRCDNTSLNRKGLVISKA